MIDKLINLARQSAGDEILRNAALPEQQHEEAFRIVGNEINDVFTQEARHGNVQGIMSMFKGTTSTGLTGNPLIKSIINNVTAKFAGKFGISPQIAGTIASGLVPKVINQFINKTNDPNDHDFELQDVLKSFTGKADVADLVGQFTGAEKGGIAQALGGIFRKKKTTV